MTTLYENEYQIRSVIARYHREAADANQLAPVADRQTGIVASVAGGLVQTLRRLVHTTRKEGQRDSTPVMTPGSPATFLHFPK
jgi:hypothetical protein